MTPTMRGPVVDLGELMAAKQAEAATAAGATYAVTVTQANLQEVLMRSMQHPVLLLATSARAQADAFTDEVVAQVNEAAGRFIVGLIDIDTEPQLAQALQIQAVPTLYVVVSGQTGVLFQGTKDRDDLRAVLAELSQMAAQNGLLGRAEPFAPTLAEGEADPRFAAADAALEAGDYRAAQEAFIDVLETFPDDIEALAGKAQSGLLLRTIAEPGFDAEAIVAAAVTDNGIEAQLKAADAELVLGQPESAFTRLVDFVRASAGDERNQARLRLLELFDTLGNADPLVQKARRDLMSALF